MSLPLVLRPIARAEVSGAAGYYDAQRDGLGDEFLDELHDMLDEIAGNPLRFPIVVRDIREAIMSRFPYTVYYRTTSRAIVVIAVFHHSRDPHDWQSRR